ncbi:LamG-like jellyroll fold domain-containing protein [Pseudooceanicola onchidii]|uniref:LamG-like jellyroll fold domain-containing protein n=1 Tax=Pseudooceanicola onchidii TaxID=2562279 RepID=UPI0010AB2116|nr:LamG-like jellyroll fold domain-containing protein [Pseudooceanicola onchidii]
MTTNEAISVYTNSELSSAINKLSQAGGGTILVHNSEEAYSVQKYMAGSAEGVIRIVAADPEDPPQFDLVKLVSSQNISFEGLKFDSSADVEGYQTDLTILKSDGISFINNTFASYSNGLNDGLGTNLVGHSLALFRDSDDLTFSGNTVTGFHQGITVINATGSEIASNDFTKLTADAVRLSGVQDTLIEGNSFYDFYGSVGAANHDDMIQVWSAPYNTQNTENLTIRDNYFNSGDGAATQTIFIKNEVYSQTGVAYENIVIEGNVIYNGHSHGITIYDTVGVQVSDNTLLQNSDSLMYATANSTGSNSAPTINLYGVTDGVVTGNLTTLIRADGHVVTDNILINYDNPAAANYIGNHLVNWTGQGDVDLRDLRFTPDSEWNGLYGAEATQGGQQSGDLTAVISQQVTPGDVSLISYDAGYSYGPDGALDPTGTTYNWTFSDGVVMQGRIVTRDYAEAGEYSVELTVSDGGTSASILRTTEVADTNLLKIDFEGGIADVSSHGAKIWVEGAEGTAEGQSGVGFHLDGTNEVHVDRGESHLKNLMNFSLSLSLARDVGGAAGTFLHIHSGLNVKITDDGAVYVGMSTSDGSFSAATEAGLVSDADWHRISISYDGMTGGGLQVYVDGVLQAETTEASGALKSGGGWDLVFGHTWGNSLQGRLDGISLIAEPMDSDEAELDYLVSIGEASEPEPTPEPSPELSLEPAPEPGPTPEPEPTPELDFSEVDMPASTGGGAEGIVLDTPDTSKNTLSTLLKLDFDTDFADRSLYESELRSSGREGLNGAGGYHLSRWNDLIIDGSNGQLQGLGDFTIALDLKRDVGGAVGTFLHQHGTLNAKITSDGRLDVKIATTNGSFQAQSEKGLLSDSDWHRLAISYDSKGGLKLFADGVLVAENTSANGSLNSTGNYDLVLGQTWSYSLQGTVDDLLIVEGAATEADAAQDNAAALAGQESPLQHIAGGSLPEPLQPVSEEPHIDLTPKELTQATLLKFDFDTEASDQSLFQTGAWVEGASGVAEGRHGGGFHLDGQNEFHIDNAAKQIQDLASFTFGMSLQRDLGGEAGTFLHMHAELNAEILADGTVSFRMTTSEGSYAVTSDAREISDADWHRLVVSYDGETGGGLHLYVDGELVGSNTEASGTLNRAGAQDLVLGHAWSDSLQGTIDDFIVVDHAVSAYAVVTDNLASTYDGGFDLILPDASLMWQSDALF